jgi:hypothetical protein
VLRPYVLELIDWKYGKGVKVFAEKNTQELCYVSAIFRKHDAEYKFKRIRLHIAQPRLSHYDVWEISREELSQFEDWARDRWALAWNGKGARIPSPKACQWCKVRTTCPGSQALLEAIADERFEVLDEVVVPPEAQQALVQSDHPSIGLTPPVELSTERLAWIYQYRGVLEAWFKDIGEELLKRGGEGHELGGLWKVVEGRSGHRTWRDEREAADALTRLGVDDPKIWKIALVSPNQAEPLLKAQGVSGGLLKRYLAMLTRRAPGKPTLAPTEDNRLSLGELADQRFEDEEL